MKYPGYKEAIAWIANNDSAADEGNNDPEEVGSLVSSIMVADLFDVSSDKVGLDVCKCRLKNGDIYSIKS